MKKGLLLIFLLSRSLFAHDCIFTPLTNEMAKDWMGINSSSTIALENHSFYNLDGTENENFAFPHDANYFEIKGMEGRLLHPRFTVRRVKRGNGKFKRLRIYGKNYDGKRTIMVRGHCRTTKKQNLSLDRLDGVSRFTGHETEIYKVIGTSKFVKIKKNRVKIKEIR